MSLSWQFHTLRAALIHSSAVARRASVTFARRSGVCGASRVTNPAKSLPAQLHSNHFRPLGESPVWNKKVEKNGHFKNKVWLCTVVQIYCETAQSRLEEELCSFALQSARSSLNEGWFIWHAGSSLPAASPGERTIQGFP